MIAEARDVPVGSELAADLCIVGGGAAGITLATAFADSSVEVVLLESGGETWEQATDELLDGSVVGLPYPLDGSRLRYFGGSMNHWGGYCRPFETTDFETHDWIPDSGWPIGLEDLAPYYPPAATMVGAAIPLDDMARWPAFDDAPGLPLADERLRIVAAQIVPRAERSMARRFRDGLAAASNVQVLLHANAVEIETDAAGRIVERIHVATLDGRRFTVRGRAVVLALGGLENARLLLASDRVRPGGVGNDHDLVGRYFLEHPRFVAGELTPSDPGNPMRLFEPHDAAGAEAIGYIALTESAMRDEGLVGVQFQLDAMHDPGVDAALDGSAATSARDLLRYLRLRRIGDKFGENVGRVAADLSTWQRSTVAGGPLPVPRPEVVAEVLRRLGTEDQDRLLPLLFGDVGTLAVDRWWSALPVRRLAVISRFEPAPRADSQVRLGDDRDALGMRRIDLDWTLSDQDLHSVARAVDILGEAVGAAGLGRVRSLLDPDDPAWPADLEIGPHHMGTTRMSDDPTRGVVDADGQVHGMDGLFVAGSSVFPTAASGTPTLTLVALALRLADHLRGRLA